MAGSARSNLRPRCTPIGSRRGKVVVVSAGLLAASGCNEILGVEQQDYARDSDADAASGVNEAGPSSDGGGVLDGKWPCQPATCESSGAECGSIDDGCGKSLDCGSCAPPKTCGATGAANQCGCVPTTCAHETKDCGSLPDNCGGTIDCGNCLTSYTCGALGMPNVCGQITYAESFESDVFVPGGWYRGQACNSTLPNFAWVAPYAAPGGGSSDLRLATAKTFDANCPSPYVTALVCKAGSPNRIYNVHTWTKNGSEDGDTVLYFVDSAGKTIPGSVTSSPWAKDSGAWKSNQTFAATSPANAAKVCVKFVLWGPVDSVADIDLVEVGVQPP